MGKEKEMSRDKLTPRELKVLILTAHGHSCKEIGKLLGIGEQTVKTQRVWIFTKLNARNSANAVAIAKDRKLI